MQLFLIHKGQTWNVSPYVSADFDGKVLRVFSATNSDLIYQSVEASPGESYYVQVFGQAKDPILQKAKMPEGRGNKILWALSFVEDKKRVSSQEEFFVRQPEVAAEYESDMHFIHYEQNNFAFFVCKKKPQPGKGRKSHQVKYKPCLAWCSDTITDEGLESLIRKYKKYRKLYCPLEFIQVI